MERALEGSFARRLGVLIQALWGSQPLSRRAVTDRARLLLLDSLGCLIAGLRAPEVGGLLGALEHGEPGPVRFPGRKVSLGVSAGALVAGAATCWDEACEGLAGAHGRPGLHAFCALYAAAQADDSDLRGLLDALTVGFEVGGRLGAALRIQSGMHVDGTWGVFGAVAAIARLLRTDAAQTLGALAGAACQIPLSLYRPVAEGATVRNLYAGAAAARAWHHVLAAGAGVTSPFAAFEELDRVFVRSPDWVALLEPDGAVDRTVDSPAPAGWLIENGYLKPYAGVRHTHYGVLAACRWAAEHGPAAAISRVRLEVYPEAVTYCGIRAPRSAISAQFSASYALAHALVFGELGPEAYGRERMEEPEIRRLEALVDLVADPLFGPRRGARLFVETEGGEAVQYAVDTVPGDPGQPLGEGEVVEKFIRYACPSLGEACSARLADAVVKGSLDQRIRALLQDAS